MVLSVTLSIRHDDGLVNAPDGMWSHHNTYNTRVILNMCLHQLSGLAVRVSALSLVSRGSIPGQVIPKTRKMGAQRLEKWHSASRVGLAVSPCNILASCPGGVLVHQAVSRYRNRR